MVYDPSWEPDNKTPVVDGALYEWEEVGTDGLLELLLWMKGATAVQEVEVRNIDNVVEIYDLPGRAPYVRQKFNTTVWHSYQYGR